ncbi:protease SohB [Legionella oakridgensis]|uniref:Periplasmic serine proteases ClpP class n=2 Tax=Legionella oakridgensis TaxID=29423 RepID=W0B8F5_9GAMM|nr:protease SohB [Legionella oakridgensis]AHE66798.1 periplasmic serine proteases ClpP class [Legionella oakridgensis ATCC 33761 = DSM 21215]ETO93512.1 inner membrane peptidase [Legionella oakridgensis RV-2-2007]KTD39804.1 signal peptide peptidase SppA [Legionella oakridgensis]STY19916.1 signal peptide peptidase SppA [Legionella longbeachae]
MEFLAEYGLFALKTFTLVIAVLLLMAGIFSLGRKPKPKLEITSLNKHWDDIKQRMQKEIFNKKPEKEKSQHKKEKKSKPSLYVLDFNGDVKASQVDQFRDEISAILAVIKQDDEIVVRLESPGGAVNAYGLAASQLQRIRDKNIPLTVCIDKIAASGGYLMACVANHIIAAPFAIIGSIGVVAQLPNFHRWLKKNDIDIELLTAGEYKRTLTLFAENTEKGRQKFKEELEQIHQSFRGYVLANREQLDIEKVATGEHWLAQDAFDLHLVDTLKTSDEYLCEKMTAFNCFKITMHGKQSLAAKLLKPTLKLLHPWA